MFTITTTRPDHAQEIAKLEQASFADPWSIEAITTEIANSICLVALAADGTVAGHITMRHILDEGHINNIAVLPCYRRHGVGNLILAQLIKTALAQGITALTLEVRASNAPAIALYTNHGFKVEGVRKNFYTQPVEDGLIMWRVL